MLSRVPWITRRSNQSIAKKINPEYSLEGLILNTEAPVLLSPDGERSFIGEDSRLDKLRQNKNGAAEDEMAK